jgi:hypothetical protein
MESYVSVQVSIPKRFMYGAPSEVTSPDSEQ